jgi:flagellar hook-length control protein FliK
VVVDGNAAAFDAILALETLAATISTVDPLAGEAALEELADSEGDREDDYEDSEEASAEDPLAFLAGLLNLAAPLPQPQPQVEASVEGLGGGGAEEVPDFTVPANAQSREAAVPAGAQQPVAPVVAAPMGESDTPNPLAGLTTPTEPVDAATADDPAARGDRETASVQGLARAAEWLSPAARHAAVERATVATHVRDARWADDFSHRVSLMVRAGESAASLQLTPVDLGPVEINLTVRDSQASIHFGAAQADTRALIEASLPRLREMLATHGFSLADASVSQGFARQQQHSNTPAAAARGDSTSPDTEVERVRTIQPLGLLDTYA